MRDEAGEHPVVVLDPDDLDECEVLVKAIGRAHGGTFVERVANALRLIIEPPPPKPDEPLGLGAVVEDFAGVLWVGHPEPGYGQNNRLWRSTAGNVCAYELVDAVAVLATGVAS